ncbi:MAG: hypothetical protein K0Q76_1330 [Panacagrimonas sp.]|jgi:hypothetical protein|nr:hypothetical protein [Panacagrimonas sp.]MCC2656222.1 hypothetical protein [Panacagrimonas sp.]
MRMHHATRSLGLLAGVAATAVHAQSFCTRLAFDEENPPGFAGRYDIIGRDAASGAAYAGTLRAETVEGKPYRLTRVVGGATLIGEAWVEACGADKFEVLRVRYPATTGAAPLELSCYLRFDGDNYTRASCTSLQGPGLEAWYQDHGKRE